MKIGVLIFITIATMFVGCGGATSTQHNIHLLGEKKVDTTTVNPNSIAVKSAKEALERNNKLEQAKVEAQAKIEIARIESQNKLSIARIDADTKKTIAKTDYQAQIETSKIDAQTYKENMEYIVYIIFAVVALVVIILIVFYLNSKKNRELQKKMHEEKLKHEQFLKEKELEEQRVHKLLELIATGKVAKNVEKEVILSISNPKKDQDIKYINEG